MSASRFASDRVIFPALVLSFAIATSTTANAQQPAPKPADAAAINQAIQNGVLYLQSVQDPRTGGWGAGTGPGSDKGWAIGYTALAGIALVECGVPNTDRGLKTAADSIRLYVDRGDLDSTYEVALAILFLERMGNKSDRKRIQSLAGRLIAGQTPTGGWGYKVPKISAADQEMLMTLLRKMSPPQQQPAPSIRERPPSLGVCIKTSDDILVKPPSAFDAEKARTSVVASLPAHMKRWSVFQGPNVTVLGDPKDKASEPFNATTDNSNTHFATLAMWAARKHDVPVERSLTLLAQRFRTSQGPDGTWGYFYARNGVGSGGSPALTCVALLGLAIGHVVDPDIAVRPEQDPRVVNAFVWLSGKVGTPVGTTVGRPTPKEAGGLYFMWSMERIAVLYDVGKLDKKDWYQWGAEILLGNQQVDGKWENGGDIEALKHPVISTSMALLFLRRANLTPDLSRRLTVDNSALTQKVSDTVSPQPAPPTVKPPEIVAPQLAPMPHEVAEVKPPPPHVPQPVVTAPTEPAAPVPEKKSSLIWIVLIVVLVAILGVCLFFYMRMKRKAEEEEEEKPRKKKRKVKAKVED
jgi:hypothetical protein